MKIEGKPADFCPKDCSYVNFAIDSVPLYVNGELITTMITISCRNEKICKMWHDRAIKMDPLYSPFKAAVNILVTEIDRMQDPLKNNLSNGLVSAHNQDLNIIKNLLDNIEGINTK